MPGNRPMLRPRLPRALLMLVAAVLALKLFGKPLVEALPHAKEIFRPHAGETALDIGVMPREALWAVHTLRRLGVAQYRLSPAVARERLWTQRIIEGAWPIRPAPDARVVVAYAGEPPPGVNCRAMHPAGRYVVYDCRQGADAENASDTTDAGARGEEVRGA